MSEELFSPADISMLSPRLKWCKKHRITTREHPRKKPRWIAQGWAKRHIFGSGDTEEDACRDFGVNNNIKLWNEEDH